jgi:hypothetical protein
VSSNVVGGVVAGCGWGYMCVSCVCGGVCDVVCLAVSPLLKSVLIIKREKSELKAALLDIGICVNTRAWSDKPSVISTFVYICNVILLLRI